jgi:NAD(P)-dependent dehydrogenase (short-subunit alcohol dehydrogenase family)
MINFKNQVAIVTGAGRGLGRLYALDIARRGGAVVVNDLGTTVDGRGSDARVADEVVDEIRLAGGTAVASYDSVAIPEGGAAIVRTALDSFGRLDAVVSNAGTFGTRAFEEITPDEWRKMLNVHLDGTFYLAQSSYRVMKRQGYGRFVLVSSSAGLFGMPHEAHYGAAKGGIFGLMNVLSVEGAADGILVNCILPTGFTRMAAQTNSAEVTQDPGHAALQAPFMKAIDPELVTPIVTFLASSACTFTHQAYSACAGRFSRVFVGLGSGWMSAKGTKPTAEDLHAHLDEMTSITDFTVPGSIFDEVSEIFARREL